MPDLADLDLQDSLPEEEPSNRNSIEPRIVVGGESEMVEMEDKMLVRADSEVPALRIPDTTLTGQTGLPETPMTQEVADSGPTVIEQADVPVPEPGLEFRLSLRLDVAAAKRQGLIHLFNRICAGKSSDCFEFKCHQSTISRTDKTVRIVRGFNRTCR